jgi:hypothetical protein
VTGQREHNEKARGLLHLLAAEPTLLDKAPGNATARDLDIRAASGTRCLRCGTVATQAFVVDTELGPRWLDLCASCAHRIRIEAISGGDGG